MIISGQMKTLMSGKIGWREIFESDVRGKFFVSWSSYSTS